MIGQTTVELFFLNLKLPSTVKVTSPFKIIFPLQLITTWKVRKQEGNRRLSRGNKTKINSTKNSMPSLRSIHPLRESAEGGDKGFTICASSAIAKVLLYSPVAKEGCKDFPLLAQTSMVEKHDWFNHYTCKLMTDVFIYFLLSCLVTCPCHLFTSSLTSVSAFVCLQRLLSWKHPVADVTTDPARGVLSFIYQLTDCVCSWPATP